MSIAILCVGKLKEKFWQDAAGEYVKRLQRYVKLEVIEVPDLPEPANASDADREQVKEKEGKALLSRIRPGDRVCALCIEGPQVESPELAKRMKADEQTGARRVYVIGGSLGLSDEVLKRADDRLSMSKMTFPHALARVMLLEQLYRGAKIGAGERYHK
ncbi:MAG: 23S rRNA (pseudouridine(1915)-N(3))-methyltransferase RlmH [Clostridiales bacterium]|nr:23S rRNA (pseudouridine(1915)-N(3))-methyltransferase RlmH [Clostridiales bacterium]